MSDDQHAGSDEPVGSVAEEAAALFAALSGFARGHLGRPEASEAAGGAMDGVADALRSSTEHFATGAPECTWCPVCQVVHAVRATSPEVRAHLAVAAHSLLEAASSALSTRVDSDMGTPGVQHIDLDDDGPSA